MNCCLITRRIKGMQLKSLCNDEATKKLCRQVLRKASLGLRDILLDRVPKKVENLKPEKADVIRTLKNYERDNIKIIESACRNRFRKTKRKRNNRE